MAWFGKFSRYNKYYEKEGKRKKQPKMYEKEEKGAARAAAEAAEAEWRDGGGQLGGVGPHGVHGFLRQLRREERNPAPRLHSIRRDALFLADLRRHPTQLVALRLVSFPLTVAMQCVGGVATGRQLALWAVVLPSTPCIHMLLQGCRPPFFPSSVLPAHSYYRPSPPMVTRASGNST
jgi:hypothetical protein